MLLVVAVMIRVGPFDLPAGKTIAAWVVAALLVGGGVALVALGPRRAAVLGAALIVVTVTVELGFMVEHGPLRTVEAPASIADTKGAVVRYLQRHPGRVVAMTLDNFADTKYLVEALRPNQLLQGPALLAVADDGIEHIRDGLADPVEGPDELVVPLTLLQAADGEQH